MMEHKAFVLDYQSFCRELRPLLEAALAGGDCRGLVYFINENFVLLRDPYEGKPLPTRWEAILEFKDAHQYGDIALTKYYDPAADIGLGGAWECIQMMIAAAGNSDESPVLGTPIGPQTSPFDPGKMGSYFQ